MRLAAAPLALLLGLSSVACSLLISGEDAPLSCSQEGQLGPPACDAGFRCLAGICQAKMATATGGGGTPASSSPDAGGAAGLAGAKGDTLGGAAGGDP